MRITLVLSVIFLSLTCVAQKYSRVKIYTNAEGLLRLSELGVPVDHGTYKHGEFFISEYSDSELLTIKENGFSFDVLIDDVQADFLEQNALNKAPEQKNASCSGATGGGTSSFEFQIIPIRTRLLNPRFSTRRYIMLANR
ncbi:MAG: hypothetical protein LW688_13500 [Cryomorphaceae bacterium]|nr:hypothetical protein [Cryomorphaceae bacterium]